MQELGILNFKPFFPLCTAQAKAHGMTMGRWPVKSVEFVRDLLKNAESNADVSCFVRKPVYRWHGDYTHTHTHFAQGKHSTYGDQLVQKGG